MRKPIEPKIVATLQEVAAHFNRHLQTIKAWRSAGCPGNPGAYDLDAIAKWRAGQDRHEDDNLADARREKIIAETRLRAAQAESAEIHAARQRGELLTPKDLQSRLIELVNDLDNVIHATIKEVFSHSDGSAHFLIREYGTLIDAAMTKIARAEFNGTTAAAEILRSADEIRRRQSGEPISVQLEDAEDSEARG